MKNWAKRNGQYISNWGRSLQPLNIRFFGADGRQLGCYVYFLCCAGEEEGHAYIKIGLSNDPLGRLKGLWTSCTLQPLSFGIVKTPSRVIAGKIERELHGVFRAWRMRGEWFKFSVEDKAQFAALRRSILDKYTGSGYPMKIEMIDAAKYFDVRRGDPNLWRQSHKLTLTPDQAIDMRGRLLYIGNK